MSALGGIGQQVVGDLFELGKGVVKGTAKAATDIATDSIEQILSAPAGLIQSDLGEKKQQKDPATEQKQAMKKQSEKRQFNEVKSRLQEYIEHKKQVDAQVNREKMEEKQQSDQKKQVEKQKKESFLQQMMARLARGSHGETDRQKE